MHEKAYNFMDFVLRAFKMYNMMRAFLLLYIMSISIVAVIGFDSEHYIIVTESDGIAIVLVVYLVQSQ